MSSILDTSSLLNTYSSNLQSPGTVSLQSSLGNINETTDKEELMKACKSFESYFVQKVLEQTKSALLENDEEKEGEYLKYFGDMFNEKYADLITENGGVGLAQQLYDSLKDRYS